MRVKITLQEYGIDKLQFGREYYIAYRGITHGEFFTFNRSNMIEMCEIINDKKVFSYCISKRELKNLLKSGVVNWMSVCEPGAI